MARNFIQDGETVTVPAPTGGVSSGDGVLIGSLFGVALTAAAAGEAVSIRTVGVFELPKTEALAIDIGDRVFWDAAEGVVNKTEAGQVCVGVAVSAAANPSATVMVKLGPALAAGAEAGG